MSGFIGTALGVVSSLGSSVNALGGLLGGNSGGISIGNITLRDWEIPEQVSFGGQQQMVVHKFVGGARIIDVMGRDDAPIRWTGMMIGPDAAQRARAIDALRKDGQKQTLVYGDFAENVVIESFEAQYKRASWIGEYSISCVVVTSPAAGSGASLFDAAGGGLSGLLGSLGGGIDSITSTVAPILNGASSAISAIGNVVLPVTSALGIHVPFLSQAQALVSTGQSAIGTLGRVSSGLTGLSNAQVSLGSIGSFLTGGVSQTGAALSSLANAAGAGRLVADGPSLSVATAAAGEHAIMVQSSGQIGQTASVLGAMRTDSAQAPAGFYLGADNLGGAG